MAQESPESKKLRMARSIPTFFDSSRHRPSVIFDDYADTVSKFSSQGHGYGMVGEGKSLAVFTSGGDSQGSLLYNIHGALMYNILYALSSP